MEQNGSEQLEQWRRKGLSESGIAYTVAALGGMILSYILAAISSAVGGEGSAEKNWYLYLAYLMPQLAIFGAVAVYFFRSKEPVRAPFQKTHPKYFLVALLMEFGLLFSLSELNGLFISGLGKLGYSSGGVAVPDLAGWNLLPALLVIGLLPAVFEETLFRGIIVRKMHGGGWGLAASVLLSGALFSLFHGKPEQTIYQFLCGACFSLIVLRAGSVLPTMLAHFLNNALILTLTSLGFGDLRASLPLWGYLVLVITSAVCFLGALVYLIFFDKRGNQRGGVKDGLFFFLAAGGGILLCAVEWIAVLVMGFTGA